MSRKEYSDFCVVCLLVVTVLFAAVFATGGVYYFSSGHDREFEYVKDNGPAAIDSVVENPDAAKDRPVVTISMKASGSPSDDMVLNNLSADQIRGMAATGNNAPSFVTSWEMIKTSVLSAIGSLILLLIVVSGSFSFIAKHFARKFDREQELLELAEIDGEDKVKHIGRKIEERNIIEMQGRRLAGEM